MPRKEERARARRQRPRKNNIKLRPRKPDGKADPGAELPRLATGIIENEEVRRERALALRCAGLSYRKIARTLGCSLRTAYGDVQAELVQVVEAKAGLAEKVFDIEDERYHQLLFSLWQRAISGNDAATGRVLQILDRIDRLYGLDIIPSVEARKNAPPPGLLSPLADQGYLTLPVQMTSGALAERVESHRRRLAEATATAIDWSAFEAAAKPSGNGHDDLAPPATDGPKIPGNGHGGNGSNSG
jgi:Homeodomain-like domain-containing protein